MSTEMQGVELPADPGDEIKCESIRESCPDRVSWFHHWSCRCVDGQYLCNRHKGDRYPKDTIISCVHCGHAPVIGAGKYTKL